MKIKFEEFSEEKLLMAIISSLNIDEHDFDEQENLLDYGLNSMDILTLLVVLAKYNSKVSYLTLISTPTWSAWKKIIFQRETV